MRLIVWLALCGQLIGCGTSYAGEPEFPTRDNRPIRVIVPFAPGGGVDVMARLIGQKLAERWDRGVIIDNRPAGGGVVGTEAVARALPDGHTLLTVSMGHAVRPSLISSLPYDTFRDFAPVIHVLDVTNIVVVHPSLPVKSIGDLVALAKKKPGQITSAVGALGGPIHLADELFTQLAGVKLTSIPYTRGFMPALIDLLGGHVELSFAPMQGPVMQFIRSGKLRALAVTSSQRARALPDVPTVAESGVKGYEAVGWQGFLAPAATPSMIVDKLYSDILAVLKTEEVSRQLTDDGSQVAGAGPKDFAAYINAEAKKWARVLATTGKN